MATGTLNTSGLMFALLPACLYNGVNPYLSGNMPSTSGNIWNNIHQYNNGTVFFPVYSPSNSYYGKLRGNAYYRNGEINCNDDGYVIVKVPSAFSIGDATEFTIHTRIKFGSFNVQSEVASVNNIVTINVPKDDDNWYWFGLNVTRFTIDEVITDYIATYIDTGGALRDGILAFRPDYAEVSTSEYVDITFVKKSDGYMDVYYNGLLLEKEPFADVPWTYGTINFNHYFGITSLPSNTFYNENQIKTYLVYDRALEQAEISALVTNSPTFGNLIGQDHNRTMRLFEPPSSQYFYMKPKKSPNLATDYIVEVNKTQLMMVS